MGDSGDLAIRVIETIADLRALEDAWSGLVVRDGGSRFRGPAWLMSWWHAYHHALGATPWLLAGERGGELLGLAPFYRRSARLAPGLKVNEIRMLGDAGPRPPALDLLCAPGVEEEFGAALAVRLEAAREQWDVVDLQPLREPSAVRASMMGRLGAGGFPVEASETPAVLRLALTVGAPTDDLHRTERFRAYTGDQATLRKGLAALRRLSRLEWAQGEEASPLADAEAQVLLEDVAARFGAEGRAHLARLDGEDDEAVAAGLVIDDEDHAVLIALAVDPEHRSAASRLIEAMALAAAERRKVALDVIAGGIEYPMPPLPVSRVRALRVRIYGHSTAASLARTAGAVRRKVESARGAPGAAAAGARAAWSRIRSAAESLGGYDRLHLYRGELWTRGLPAPEGLTVDLFAGEAFEQLGPAEREVLVESLALDVEHARALWRSGELAVLARLRDRPAGIAWCARGQVFVPELDRSLSLNGNEAYIHEVYVAPQARGRAVAAAMLEFLAGELRRRDIYRSWALIDAANAASSRAFEKAAYVAIADVIHTRMAVVDRLSVQPPDPEARRLLGLE